MNKYLKTFKGFRLKITILMILYWYGCFLFTFDFINDFKNLKISDNMLYIITFLIDILFILALDYFGGICRESNFSRKK
jgi:hypothetical protein